MPTDRRLAAMYPSIPKRGTLPAYLSTKSAPSPGRGDRALATVDIQPDRRQEDRATHKLTERKPPPAKRTRGRLTVYFAAFTEHREREFTSGCRVCVVYSPSPEEHPSDTERPSAQPSLPGGRGTACRQADATRASSACPRQLGRRRQLATNLAGGNLSG